MKKLFFLFLFFISATVYSQIDYSDSWEDFYSYNNVKDFLKVDNIIYALADNAVFTFDETTSEIKKFSSIQGLSGETTSAIFYSKTYKRLVIGYENGLVEVIDDNGEITISSDIINFNQSGQKRINHISEHQNKLFLSTPFAIVEYNIEKLEFGDTFFIGNASTSLEINQTTVFNDKIYAATEDGIFSADVNSNLLIDFNNWENQFSNRNFSTIKEFNNKIFVTEGNILYQLNNSLLTQERNFFEPIINITSSVSHLTITLNKSAVILDAALNNFNQFVTTQEFNFNLSNAIFENSNIYLATNEFGFLKSTITQPNIYEEIHPEGPLSNEIFSIDVLNNDLWIVYGGHNIFYGSLDREKGFSHFNGDKWINTRYDPNFPVRDMNYVTIDPNFENKAYISSMGVTPNFNSVSTGGVTVVEDDEVKTFYNHLNSSLEDIEPNNTNVIVIRVTGTTIDNQGNLWVCSMGFNEELKKLSPSGQWSSYDLSSLKTVPDKLGLSEIAIDRSNNLWIGTFRNGVYIYNEIGEKKAALIATPNLGNLPNAEVYSLAVDNNNRVWIGTKTGLVVYRNASGIFNETVLNAQPIIIEENGVGERLLGDQKINTILIDGAENKWFGTESGGVLYTNPTGRTTLAKFSKENSPLPSNKILKIRVDKSTGKVYFATDKGIVAYNSKVAPFGDVLADVYAYPNPALKNHETITIDGRNGTHLPKGTNVKILDVAGNLVYETTVEEGQELQGGKVVWNKKNLSGNKVASGIYIVLMANDDASETATTKIAIVN